MIRRYITFIVETDKHIPINLRLITRREFLRLLEIELKKQRLQMKYAAKLQAMRYPPLYYKIPAEMMFPQRHFQGPFKVIPQDWEDGAEL